MHTPKKLRSGKIIDEKEGQDMSKMSEREDEQDNENACSLLDDTVGEKKNETSGIEVQINKLEDLLKQVMLEIRGNLNVNKPEIIQESITNDELSKNITSVVPAQMLGRIKFPRGGWLKNPFEDVKYFDRRDARNPMRFLMIFEKNC